MTISPSSSSPGCVLGLLALSDAMRGPLPRKRPITKLQAARLLWDDLLDSLVKQATSRGVGPDVAVVGYRAGPGGQAEFLPLLEGTSAANPWLTADQLAACHPASRRQGPRRWVVPPADCPGPAPTREAFRFAYNTLIRWLETHPLSAPPVVVHCAGEPGLGPIAERLAVSLGSLSTPSGRSALAHCLYLEGRPPTFGEPLSGEEWTSFWRSASPLPGLDASRRALAVNCWPRRSLLSLIAHDTSSSATSPAPALKYRAFWMPKEGEPESSWEDAYDVNSEGGLAAICDGASAGIYCRNWAGILAHRFVQERPDLDDPPARAEWIRSCRGEWRGTIDFQKVRPLALNKINATGAAATFLGVHLGCPLAGESSDDRTLRWTAWSVGDASLLYVRDGRLTATFPVVSSEDYGLSPRLFRSLPAAGFPAPVLATGVFAPGDWLVLATDAIAQHLLAREERGEPNDYESLWDMDQDAWRAEVCLRRERQEIVDDDCTLVILRLADSSPDRSDDPAEELAPR